MLGKSKTTGVKASPAASEAPASVGTIIGAGAVLDGNLTTPDSARIDGILTGNLECGGSLTLGATGKITGNIKAAQVMVSGEVTGDIYCGGKLDLYSTGRIIGDITAKALVIDEDAYFDGRCAMLSSRGPEPGPALELEELPGGEKS